MSNIILVRSQVLRSIKSPLCITLIPKNTRMYSEGSVGSPRGGSEDSFLRRERAKEDFFVRQHEKEQFKHFKEQLKNHQKQLEHLESKIDKLSNGEKESK
ncbi:ATPase-binding protein NDAI_0A02250 [Naumovozyma dairenensis CBS 421]|uniref:ATPase inhibitor, mitochondrial n=1 Tax=Naumovozyma dairenensis (strain ATCC 10597 / BCRC 20456 / CBS 421 / NBRC 0211 / NRRL Y-12639) TaxID=1071378 RepID=G0W3J5_NAUDC|nr:hypothetical protein NDAI_0A02250 [Naumovozyma dairenensis CBS 421]CCD22383.1 hypothetical protein NDAI_0A02250 [Naumovozyma dairenensis CBS 421]